MTPCPFWFSEIFLSISLVISVDCINNGIFLPPLPCCFPGLRALWKWGGYCHHPAGEEDPHHNLSAGSPPRVSGKPRSRTSLCHWKWGYLIGASKTSLHVKVGLKWDSDLYFLWRRGCVSPEWEADIFLRKTIPTRYTGLNIRLVKDPN